LRAEQANKALALLAVESSSLGFTTVAPISKKNLRQFYHSGDCTGRLSLLPDALYPRERGWLEIRQIKKTT